MSILSRAVAYWRTNGMLFGGNRNLYRTFGWVENPQHKDFVAMYLRQDVAGRVNDALPKALWSDPPEVTGGATFDASWTALLTTIPVFPTILRLDKLAGLGRYAVMLIGYDDGRPLNEPVRAGANRKVIFLQPYGEASATVTQYETSTSSPRFGMPLMYRISPGELDPEFATQMRALLSPVHQVIDVHYTRILHVADGILESSLFGCSRLKPVFNILSDIQKVAGSSAETYWLAGNRGLHVDIDKEMELDEDDAENLSEELKEYEHELRRVVRTRGVKINSLGSEFADPSGVFAVQIALLAARTGIPQRILMGSEAGQLASQQDRAEWAQRVKEQVMEVGGPIILYPFIRTLINAGVLPEPEGLKVKWPDAFKMNPLERAQTSAQMARSAANLAKTLQTIESTNQAAATARQSTMQTTVNPETGVESSQETPALINTPYTEVTLLSPEECRSIIGFGQHPPVFDDTDAIPATTGTPSKRSK